MWFLIAAESMSIGRGDIVCTWARQDSVCYRDLCNGVLLVLGNRLEVLIACVGRQYARKMRCVL